MAAVIPLAPRRAWRERVRAVEEAIAEAWPEYERALKERETGHRRAQFRRDESPRLRLVVR